jgi:hypothetical protein
MLAYIDRGRSSSARYCRMVCWACFCRGGVAGIDIGGACFTQIVTLTDNAEHSVALVAARAWEDLAAITLLRTSTRCIAFRSFLLGSCAGGRT